MTSGINRRAASTALLALGALARPARADEAGVGAATITIGRVMPTGSPAFGPMARQHAGGRRRLPCQCQRAGRRGRTPARAARPRRRLRRGPRARAGEGADRGRQGLRAARRGGFAHAAADHGRGQAPRRAAGGRGQRGQRGAPAAAPARVPGFAWRQPKPDAQRPILLERRTLRLACGGARSWRPGRDRPAASRRFALPEPQRGRRRRRRWCSCPNRS